MKRILPYLGILGILFIAFLVITSLVTKDKDLGLGAGVYVLIYVVIPLSIIALITFLIYEYKHPIQDYHSYKKINFIAGVIVIATIITGFLYLLPVISNFSLFSKVPQNTRGWAQPTISDLLLHKYILWRYILLLLGLVTLVLSLKKKQVVRFVLLLTIFLAVVLQLSGLGFWGNKAFSALNYSHRKMENLSNLGMLHQAGASNDVSQCPQSGLDRDRCIKDIALNTNDISLCKGLDYRIESECVIEFVLQNNDVKICQTLVKGENYPLDYVRNCVKKLAIQQLDESICEVYNYDKNEQYNRNFVLGCNREVEVARMRLKNK